MRFTQISPSGKILGALENLLSKNVDVPLTLCERSSNVMNVLESLFLEQFFKFQNENIQKQVPVTFAQKKKLLKYF